MRRFVVSSYSDSLHPTAGMGDLTPVFARLRVRPKGEYETTTDFHSRAGKVLQGLTIAIAVTPGPGGKCGPSFSYDADTEEFSAYLSTASPLTRGSGGHVGDIVEAFELRCTMRSAGSYIGTNGFGVRTIVSRSVGTAVSVVKAGEPESAYISGNVSFKMSRFEASRVKPHLRIVAVFEPHPSPRGTVIESGIVGSLANMISPRDVTVRHTVIWARSLSFWVLDGRTGRVLAKHDVGAQAVATAPTPDIERRSASGEDQPFSEFQVEKTASTVPGQAGPRYPDMLKSANIEGEVLAQFVVDTTGRFEPGSFKSLKSSHDLFTAAVRNALPNMRFYPAEVGGRKVKQRVQQSFTFARSRS